VVPVGKINLAVWGIVVFLVGFFFMMALAADRGSNLGIVYACLSSTLIAASLMINLFGIKDNMNRGKIFLVFIGGIFSIPNMILYLYSLYSGISRVAEYNYYLTFLLVILSLFAPVGIALRVYTKAGMASTRDRYLFDIKKRGR
jgi:hypothetical protein